MKNLGAVNNKDILINLFFNTWNSDTITTKVLINEIKKGKVSGKVSEGKIVTKTT